jgi:hypothetical protein
MILEKIITKPPFLHNRPEVGQSFITTLMLHLPREKRTPNEASSEAGEANVSKKYVEGHSK